MLLALPSTFEPKLGSCLRKLEAGKGALLCVALACRVVGAVAAVVAGLILAAICFER